MFYGAMVWDPLLILAQIGCLQGLNYITLGLLLWTFVGTQVNDFTLKYFFDYKVLSLGSFVGICSILAHLLNSLVGSFFLLVIVERTKKCLDFTATTHLIHFILCVVYGGLPASIVWWLLNAISLIAMTVFGEWLCMRKEQQDIPLGGSAAPTFRSNRASSSTRLPL